VAGHPQLGPVRVADGVVEPPQDFRQHQGVDGGVELVQHRDAAGLQRAQEEGVELQEGSCPMAFQHQRHETVMSLM
jgi:hypothetical protein